MHFPHASNLRSVLLSPFFLALTVIVVIIFLLPDLFSKYHAELVKKGMVDKKDGYEYFTDLDHDGNSEKLVLFNNTEGQAAVKLVSHEGFILDHFYFPGQILPDWNSLVAGQIEDAGNNGFFLLTARNDSIFLQGISPFAKDKIICRDVFITRACRKNGRFDFMIPSMKLYDLNRDGCREVVSGMIAGFPLQPRLIFSYDFKAGLLYLSPKMGSDIRVIDTADINHDGFPELLTYSYAISNYPDTTTIAYDDHSAWLMVFDRELNFLFPPEPFFGKYLSLTTTALQHGGKYFLVGLQYARASGDGYPKLMLFDKSGKLLKTRILDDTLKLRHYSIQVTGKSHDRLWLIRERGMIEEVDDKLQTIRKKEIEGLDNIACYSLDIDGDEKPEFFFPGNDHSTPMITREDFMDPVKIDLPFENQPTNFNVRKIIGKPGQLFIQQGTQYFLFEYDRNPWHYLRIPVYLFIYLVVLGFILLVQYLQRVSMRQKFKAEKKIAEMQLLLLRNQIDPHFTFNAINAISASVLQNNPEEANDNILRLARLMRSCVEQADQLSRSLSLELEFVKNYLDLLKSRMDHSFAYVIEIADDVDLNMQVPKMILQIYVENAIKHGIRPLKGGGQIWIRVKHTGQYLNIEIEDNGIGRVKARENGSRGTGKGMQIMEQFFVTFNKYNHQKISLEIKDLMDENQQACGTTIVLNIPAGMKYNFYEK